MPSLRKRLQNLFSTNVIVRSYGKDRLRVVDTNRLQGVGNINQTKVTDRYARMYNSNKYSGGANGGYDTNYNLNQNRIQLYTDYEMMDKDPIISSALDIYSDESTLADQFGDILTIKTSKTQIQKILYNLFNLLKWLQVKPKENLSLKE